MYKIEDKNLIKDLFKEYEINTLLNPCKDSGVFSTNILGTNYDVVISGCSFEITNQKDFDIYGLITCKKCGKHSWNGGEGNALKFLKYSLLCDIKYHIKNCLSFFIK